MSVEPSPTGEASSSNGAGAPVPGPAAQAPRRPNLAFMLGHPARLLALGFGSGLSPLAPGTVGTLWAWLVYAVLQYWLGDWAWALLITAAAVLGVAVCTKCAQDLAVSDPSSIVWDEVVAFWLVLWLIMPTSLWGQVVAFALFRFFDAAKPGPVAWADRLFKRLPGQSIGWRQGFGIMFDDAVAALCTLLVYAVINPWIP